MPSLTGVLTLVLCVACYKGVLVSAASHYLQLGTWTTLAQVNRLTDGLVILEWFKYKELFGILVIVQL